MQKTEITQLYLFLFSVLMSFSLTFILPLSPARIVSTFVFLSIFFVKRDFSFDDLLIDDTRLAHTSKTERDRIKRRTKNIGIKK